MKRRASSLWLMTGLWLVTGLALDARAARAESVQAFALAEATILAPGAGIAASAVLDFGRSGAADLGVGEATLTIEGQPGDAVSILMPESVAVRRAGDGDTLMLQTQASGAASLLAGGSGALPAALTAMDIRGRLMQTAGFRTGAYQGEFVVIIQYN